MARPSGPKTRCSGTWTESKFNSFIRSQLRGATRKWGPIQEAKKDARVGYGTYECNHCKQHVPPTKREGRTNVANIFVDHIEPIATPGEAQTDWNVIINRMFCEKDNLQLLCGDCHDKKTLEERATAKAAREAIKAKESLDAE